MNHYICIDIGGTAIKYGLADSQGNFLHKGSLPTEIREKGVQDMLETLQGIAKGYRQTHKEATLSGIAVSTPGIVDADKGEIVFVGPNFPGYTGTKLKAEMEQRTGLPCEVENDVNAAGLGESWLGAGQGAKSAVCIAVGTGIGGCVILDGKLLHGAANCAGEVGYLQIEPGCRLEERAATSSLVHEVAKSRGLSPDKLDGRTIFAEAKAGKKDAAQAIDGMVQRLAVAIANICCLLNPERIILGGGIMEQEDYLRPRLEAALERAITIAPIRTSTTLAFARLGNDAAMVGALYHFLQKHPR